MIGLEELIDPYRKEIMEAVNACFAKVTGNTACVTTLWASYSSCDYFGEWDSSTEYYGVFELKDIRKLVQ